MNLILIICDTLRRDHLGCYGNEWISTPNIDRFASRSIVFDRAYAASFPTVPHRHDVLTGRYTFIDSQWQPLPRDEVVLAEELAKVGYCSMMILDQPHTVENGFHYDRGFTGWEWIRGQETDRWQTAPATPPWPCDPARLRSPEKIVRVHQRNIHWRRGEEDTFVARTMTASCRWLERNWREHDRFFLYVDTFDPHEPWDAPQWYVEMYDPGYEGPEVTYPVYGPCDYLTPAELRHARALYAAEVTLVDRWVGRLLEKIEDMGLLENSLVVLTTDHGFYHGEHGLIGKVHITPEWSRYVPLYEEVARIPLIVHFPGCEARREQALVQPLDLMPTFLEIAGAPDPGTMHGRSFLPLLEGRPTAWRDYAVTSPTIIHGAGGGTRPTVTTDEWSFICAGTVRDTGEFESRAVDGLPKRGRADEAFPSELYHLATDPAQQHDVADRHPEVVRALREEFVRFLKRLGTARRLIEPWR
ncbi:MAG: sulfatase [Anaerolineae bacterium]|nr:sulfatase [Anaerolineae bacterium]